ncbi:unnamed protein product [Haemonchus placei]|uniref:Uncharacterized protein n=1 Tax=Haemonchus placei TaxID=6290 RepID=A0A0N4W4N5_HAEPC|nr:unnamed protein product [Haemonchus placei]
MKRKTQVCGNLENRIDSGIQTGINESQSEELQRRKFEDKMEDVWCKLDLLCWRFPNDHKRCRKYEEPSPRWPNFGHLLAQWRDLGTTVVNISDMDFVACSVLPVFHQEKVQLKY